MRKRSVGEFSQDPIHAWNVLASVNDSVRHAETKGALILGAAGAVGGVLYNLYGARPHGHVIIEVAVVACAVSTVAAAVFAACCLMPRLRPKDPANSVVYFHHIARRHQGTKGRADYGVLLKTVSARHELLIDDLATQIWANAQIARRKYLMASIGITAILAALGALAVVVIATVIT